MKFVFSSTLGPSPTRASWTNRPEYRSAEANSHDFPVRRNRFPVSGHREFDATTTETLENLGAEFLKGICIRSVSLYFPCITGMKSKRRVRSRLVPPPLSLPARRLFSQDTRRPRKSRDSAGFWMIRFSQGNRKLLVPSPTVAEDCDYLCCQFGRFPFALDSPEREPRLIEFS